MRDEVPDGAASPRLTRWASGGLRPFKFSFAAEQLFGFRSPRRRSSGPARDSSIEVLIEFKYRAVTELVCFTHRLIAGRPEQLIPRDQSRGDDIREIDWPCGWLFRWMIPWCGRRRPKVIIVSGVSLESEVGEGLRTRCRQQIGIPPFRHRIEAEHVSVGANGAGRRAGLLVEHREVSASNDLCPVDGLCR